VQEGRSSVHKSRTGQRQLTGLALRIVGKVLDGERDVNLALVRDGMCWWYRKYGGEQSPVDRNLYDATEAKAKANGAGLWSDPAPVPPWDWRRR
jgi:endonuclease YncB( thermonuclease family)